MVGIPLIKQHVYQLIKVVNDGIEVIHMQVLMTYVIVKIDMNGMSL
jgi:hypothetical protein